MKANYHAKSDVFLKVLDGAVLDRPAGYTADYYVLISGIGVSDYVGDLRDHPDFNPASRVLAKRYTGSLSGSTTFRFVFGYFKDPMVSLEVLDLQGALSGA